MSVGFIVAQLLTGLASASALFLVASGLSIIFGVTRVVNFAHGSFYMLGAYIAYTLTTLLPGGLGFWASLLLAALAVGLVGLVVEVVVLKPIYRSPELYQLVATFGVILIVQDLTLMTWGAEDLLGPRAPGLEGAIRILDEPVPVYDLALIALALLVLGGLWLLFNKTRAGVLVRAATEDREMVAALGVNQTWLFTGVFVLGSALAGLGGAAQLPRGGADLLMDFAILAPAFVVVVVGGMGSILGAYIAAVLISELNVFGVWLLPQSSLVLMFVAMAVVLVVRPWGLLGRPERAGEGAATPGLAETPLHRFGVGQWFAAAVIFVLLACLPLLDDGFLLVFATDILIFCLFAASLHYILGIGGLVSFGHAAYFGGGAYAAALAVKYLAAPMPLAMLSAPLGAGLVAFLVGWFCVRLSGVYFAMLTLAFAQVLWSIVTQWIAVTGGDDGILGIWPAAWAGGANVYYYLTLVVAGGGVLGLRLLAYTPLGHALRAARDSERRSEAIGIDVKRVRWLSFTLAGAMAGIAGGLFVFAKGSVFPTEMEITRSFDALIAVFLGGVQSLSGPIVGSTAFLILEDYLTRFEYWRLALGVLIVLIVVLFPGGLVGVKDLFRRRRAGEPEAAPA